MRNPRISADGGIADGGRVYRIPATPEAIAALACAWRRTMDAGEGLCPVG